MKIGDRVQVEVVRYGKAYNCIGTIIEPHHTNHTLYNIWFVKYDKPIDDIDGLIEGASFYEFQLRYLEEAKEVDWRQQYYKWKGENN